MEDVLAVILGSAVGGGAVAAAIVWISRLWISERIKNSIKNEYDQKLETHKAQLKSQADLEIERFRSQLKGQNDLEMERLRSSLSIAAKEREIRFSRLHERRAETIARTYALLKNLHKRLADYVAVFEPAGAPSKEERRKLAAEAYKAFAEYSDANIIFVPKRTASRLDEIRQKIFASLHKFLFAVEVPSGSNVEAWTEIFEEVNGPIMKSLNELADEFRTLLGDEEQNHPKEMVISQSAAPDGGELQSTAEPTSGTTA